MISNDSIAEFSSLKRPSHGKLKLANPTWCVWTAWKQSAHTFLFDANSLETCLPPVFVPFTHTNLGLQSRVCQLKFAMWRTLYKFSQCIQGHRVWSIILFIRRGFSIPFLFYQDLDQQLFTLPKTAGRGPFTVDHISNSEHSNSWCLNINVICNVSLIVFRGSS